MRSVAYIVGSFDVQIGTVPYRRLNVAWVKIDAEALFGTPRLDF